MNHNRRSFLGLGSLVACGVALNASSLFGPAARVLPGGGALLAEDAVVLDFVRGYSSNFHVIVAPIVRGTAPISGGASLCGSSSRALHVLVEIADVDRLRAAFARPPAARIHAQGNTLSFALGDAEVSVENLLPELFAARMAAMAQPSADPVIS